MVTPYGIVRAALNKGGLLWTGGHYPLHKVISYDGGDIVEMEGRKFLVKGFKCGGRWDEKIWCNGADGGIAIYENGIVIHKESREPGFISIVKI